MRAPTLLSSRTQRLPCLSRAKPREAKSKGGTFKQQERSLGLRPRDDTRRAPKKSCHPERSEGSHCGCNRYEILRFARFELIDKTPLSFNALPNHRLGKHIAKARAMGHTTCRAGEGVGIDATFPFGAEIRKDGRRIRPSQHLEVSTWEEGRL